MNELFQILALATVAYGEAEGEPFQGKVAVCWAVKVRADTKWRGKCTYSSVALDPMQFSCFNDGSPRLPKMTMPLLYSPKAYVDCVKAAFGVHYGWIPNPFPEANHYHETKIGFPPGWGDRDQYEFLGEIGKHSFYKSLW